MNHVFLKCEGKYRKLLFSEILFFEGYKNYVQIQTTKAVLTVHYSLKQIEENIPSTLFIRIHKSFIVAIEKISEFDCDMVYIGKKQLPLSAQFSAALKSKLNIVHSQRRTKMTVDKDGSLISDEPTPES